MEQGNPKLQFTVLRYAPWKLLCYILGFSALALLSMFPFFLYEFTYAWCIYFGLMAYCLAFVFLIIVKHRFKSVEIVKDGVVVYGKFRNPVLLEWEDIEDIGTTRPASLGGLQRVIVEMKSESDSKYLSKVNLLYRFWVWLHLVERDGFSISTYLMNESADVVKQMLEDAQSEYYRKKLGAKA